METIQNFISNLVGRANALMDESLGSGSDTPDFIRGFTRISESALQVLTHAELQPHKQRVRAILQECSPNYGILAEIVGVLESASECLANGFVGQLRFMIHAEMFGTLAEQARELLKHGHKIPAAVLGRIAIEDWLRDESQRTGIPTFATDRAAKLNDALKASGKLSPPKWRLLQSFLDVGNSAAHGKSEEFAEADVTRMLDFIETNCV